MCHLILKSKMIHHVTVASKLSFLQNLLRDFESNSLSIPKTLRFLRMAATSQRVSKASRARTPPLFVDLRGSCQSRVPQNVAMALVPLSLVWFSPPEGTPCYHPLIQVRSLTLRRCQKAQPEVVISIVSPPLSY
jgi:hypothetical protein